MVSGWFLVAVFITIYDAVNQYLPETFLTSPSGITGRKREGEQSAPRELTAR
jgi:hypothetical protein